MKKNKLIPIALCGAFAIVGLAACNSDEPGMQSECTSAFENRLALVLTNAVENRQGDEDTYILYDAKSDDFTTATASEYEVACAFANLLMRDNSGSALRPEGSGWIKYATGNGTADAIKISMKLSKDIPMGQNFEIHVEYLPNGTYVVWYRYVK